MRLVVRVTLVTWFGGPMNYNSEFAAVVLSVYPLIEKRLRIHIQCMHAHIIKHMLTTTFDMCIMHSCSTYMLLDQAQHTLARLFTASILTAPPRPPSPIMSRRRTQPCAIHWWIDMTNGGACERQTFDRSGYATTRPFAMTARHSIGVLAARFFGFVHNLRAGACVP